jgi:hypothetical protein
MSPLYLYNGQLLITPTGQLATSEDCCCDFVECKITPTSSSIELGDVVHTLDAAVRTVVLNYEAGPLAFPRNNPQTSAPNSYDIYCNNIKIASTNGFVGGTNYKDAVKYPHFQPLVGGPVGTISGVKPAGFTTIIVRVGGDSPSFYSISCI